MDIHGRLAVAAGLALSPLLPLSARLTHLQVMQHRDLESRAAVEISRTTEEFLPRADILDRRGRILAQSLPAWSCFVEKAQVKDRRLLAAQLGRILNVSTAEIGRRLAGPGRFSWIDQELGEKESTALAEARLPGVGIILSHKRFYPNQELARNVLGKVGSENRGLSGLEFTFDARLRGKPRRLEYLRDGFGRAIYRNASTAFERPQALRLTLDRDIQFHAEDALREATLQFHAKGGIVVVQDPSNGEILAMAANPATPLKNPVVQDTYEPGSTFKLVAAAAALEESLVSESETFFCENGIWEVAPGVKIHDHEPAGSLTLQGILEQSSNIGIAKVVERVGAMRFYRASRAFGFAIKTGIDLPGETAGDMKPLAALTRVVLAASSYGYGIGVSALQVANAYSSMANGGTLYEPSILSDGRRPARVRRVIGEPTAQVLARMLESIVARGTGVSARIPGYRVAGKTGTARKLDARTKQYSNSAYMASFVGFLPVSRPRWTILVVIDEPKGQYYGAQVAAPVFAKLGRRLLAMDAVPPDQTEDPSPQSIAAQARTADRPARLPWRGNLPIGLVTKRP
ncbi:MAG TPA: penicillin-binding protein [Elusimicrobia bacterium]|nr:penicillin-binding protein [Elusimicrobiota bacterium]HBT62292.1 penicillin-binding protein [Elusimicrobiota bacterium]